MDPNLLDIWISAVHVNDIHISAPLAWKILLNRAAVMDQNLLDNLDNCNTDEWYTYITPLAWKILLNRAAVMDQNLLDNLDNCNTDEWYTYITPLAWRYF